MLAHSHHLPAERWFLNLAALPWCCLSFGTTGVAVCTIDPDKAFRGAPSSTGRPSLLSAADGSVEQAWPWHSNLTGNGFLRLSESLGYLNKSLMSTSLVSIFCSVNTSTKIFPGYDSERSASLLSECSFTVLSVSIMGMQVLWQLSKMCGNVSSGVCSFQTVIRSSTGSCTQRLIFGKQSSLLNFHDI